MKNIIINFVVVFIIASCVSEKPTESCNPDNPFEMEWLQKWIEELQHCVCTISVFQAEYKGEPVFWQLMNDPLCESIITNVSVVNCWGEEILVLISYADWIEFNKHVNKGKIIYSC